MNGQVVKLELYLSKINMDKTKSIDDVILEIKELVSAKGFIYALCMILFEDFHVAVEKMHQIDYRSRNEIDFSTPDTPQDLILLKQKTLQGNKSHNFSMPPDDSCSLWKHIRKTYYVHATTIIQ